MILKGVQARNYLANPGNRFGCILLHGTNTVRVTDKRIDLAKRLVGPDAARDLRLTVLQAAHVTKKPGAVADNLKAVGFFPGPRLVVVEGATDAVHKQLARALSVRNEGDAFLIVTAGALSTRSNVRKLFEGGKTSVAIGVYDEPLDRVTIEAMAYEAELTALTPESVEHLVQSSAFQTASEIRNTLEKLALYAMGRQQPVTPRDIELLAPDSRLAGMEDVLFAVAEGRPSDVVVPLQRLYAQGVSPDSVCRSAYTYFRSLQKVALHDGRLDAAFLKLRPPVFGPTRDRMANQVRRWGEERLEAPLRELFDVCLALRSTNRGPDSAVVERVLLRIAWMAPKPGFWQAR